MTVPSRDELRDHLIATRIAGDVATPRSNNLANITKMLERQWDYWFGLELDRAWTAAEVLDVLVKRVGMHPELSRNTGADVIDPDLTIDGLDAAAEMLADVVERRGRVLVATGHPTGVLSLHLHVADALQAAGADVITPATDRFVAAAHLPGGARVRYVGAVAMLSNGADLLHTHAAEPMQVMLAAGPRPDLVFADHGFAGAAAQAGIPTVGFADTNDPALFVGAEEGKVAVAIPLDDNVPPVAYEPLAAYIARHLRSTAAG